LSGVRDGTFSSKSVCGTDWSLWVIRFENVSKVFRARRGETITALNDISFEVSEQEFVAIVGPSGCGKSTLLKLVAGLQNVTRGAIFLRGEQIVSPSMEIGFVFQQPVLLPWRSVLDNVLLPIEMLGLDRQSFRQRAHELISIAGLRGFERRLPRELSGGMQQRVSICRALLHDPKLLLMDEPFGALDALTREEMSFALLKVWESSRKTILFVTHSITEAVLLADRVLVMTPRPGRISRIVEIQLTRPRHPDLEDVPEFRTYAREIRGMIFDKGAARRSHA
jgi:NitT/TauT family transport system ATP-binding protein